MNDNLKPLFTPWKIGNLEIKNRVVLTSLGGTNLLGFLEKHHFDKEGAQFILSVAQNNAGLVLPGCQPIFNPMTNEWLYENHKMFEDLKAWMPEFHKTGAKLFIQLTAGFGRSFPISPMMEKLYKNRFLRVVSKPFFDVEKVVATASPCPNRWSDVVPSRALTKDEIHAMIDGFIKSAKLCQDAGVDGVEIHAVHEGYLLDQFTTKYTNRRTDEYGGTLENRLRFPVEIVKGIKEACGKDFPVSVRYSVVSKTKGFRSGALPGENFIEVGRDFEESKAVAKIFKEAGYDMLNCDNGSYDAWYWSHPPIYMPENCNLSDVIALRKAVDIPVVAAGRIDPVVGAEAVKNGQIDGVGWGRNFLADPAWMTKLMNGQADDIRPCILCHNGCFNMSHYKGVPNDQDLEDTTHLSRCAVNAETMQFGKHYIEQTTDPKTVHIIGGGVGGMETARVLKLRGHNPVIYEKSDVLGGTLIAAAAESYKGKVKDLLNWYRHEMKRLNIEVKFNTEISVDNKFGSDPVVVATGSTPKTLNVDGYELAIEACDYLNGKKKVGNKVVVIGGGLTGCETAYGLALDGHQVTIVETKNDIIAQKGVCMANSTYLREWFALHQIPVHLETKVKSISDSAVICCDKDGDEFTIPCDSVISSIGYNPAPLNVKAKKVYLVGDCEKVGTLRTVVWRAYEVAMEI